MRIMLALAPVTLLVASSQATTVYNPATQFSNSANPSTLWVYGYSPTLGSPLIPFTETRNVSGVDFWQNNILHNEPAVLHNPTGSPITLGTPLIDAGGLALHPGPNGEIAILRFIVPSAGDYHITGSFYGQDTVGTTTDVHIFVNGLPSLDGTVSGFGAGTGPSFDNTVTLTAGGLLDFAVGVGTGGFGWDTTGLSVQIAVVPEPSAISLLAVFGIGGSLVRRRYDSRRTAQAPRVHCAS